MKKLLVYADFDWLGQVELVGELTMDSVRGGETYGFMYDANWLKKHGEMPRARLPFNVKWNIGI